MNAQTKIEAGSLHSDMALAFAKIEGATKSAAGQVGQQRYKYADLGSVIEAIKPALIEHSLFYLQHCHPADNGVCVETVLYHAGGDQISLGKLFVPANKHDAQGFGSALTYARRYALVTAFGVPTEDDDGSAATKTAPPANARQAKLAAERDAPFPLGPAKNKTDLKAMGRSLWTDVMACGDADELTALLSTNKALIDQLKSGLPQWWGGGSKDGEAYEGLGQVIERLERDFAGVNAAGMDWRGNILNAG